LNISTRGRLLLKRHKIALVLVLILIAGEIAIRLADPKLNDLTYYQFENIGTYRRPEFLEDAELFWMPPTRFQGQIDQARAYGGENLIYVFGGSIAFGAQTKKNFSEHLQDMLDAAGRPGRVVNFAYGGYSSYQCLKLCQRVLRQRVPRIVVLCNGYNDASRISNTSDKVAAQKNRSLPLRTLYYLNRVKLFAGFRSLLLAARNDLNRYYKFGSSSQAPVTRVPLADYDQNLSMFVELEQERKFSLVLVSQAMPMLKSEKQLDDYFLLAQAQAGADRGVYFADVRPLFQDYRQKHNIEYMDHTHRDRDALFADTLCHPTELGHQLYAQAIFNTLVESGLLN